MEVYASRNAELLARYKNGDKAARDLLCSENMGLVKKIVSGFSRCGAANEDLIQTGAIGLIKAIDNFDITVGVQFSTYAVPMILGEIKRFLRDDGLIKVSRSLKQAAARGTKAREELKKTLKREPTINEISEKCGISTEDLVCAFDASREPESIDRTLYGNSEQTVSDRLCISDEEERITDRILVRQILERITAKERQVIVLRYFKGKSQQEIADMLGVSQVQISRTEKKVLEKIRKNELS